MFVSHCCRSYKARTKRCVCRWECFLVSRTYTLSRQEFERALPPLERKRKTVLASDDVMAMIMTNAFLDEQLEQLKEQHPDIHLVQVGELRRRGRARRTFCHCDAGDEPNAVWIGCEMCGEWYHPPCVGLGDMTKQQVKELPDWTCDECKGLESPAPTARAARARDDDEM